MRPCRESPFDSKPRPSAQPTQRRHPPAAGHPEHNQPEPVPRACPQDSPGACPQGRNLRSLSLRDSSRSPRSLRLRVEAIPGAGSHSRSLSPEPVPGACPQSLSPEPQEPVPTRLLSFSTFFAASRGSHSRSLSPEPVHGACPRSLSPGMAPSGPFPNSRTCPCQPYPPPPPKAPPFRSLSPGSPSQGWLHPGRSQTHEPVPASPTHLHPQKPPLSGACPLGACPLGSSSRISRSGRAGSIRSNASRMGASRPNPDFHAASGGMGPRLAACCHGPGKVGERPT